MMAAAQSVISAFSFFYCVPHHDPCRKCSQSDHTTPHLRRFAHRTRPFAVWYQPLSDLSCAFETNNGDQIPSSSIANICLEQGQNLNGNSRITHFPPCQHYGSRITLQFRG